MTKICGVSRGESTLLWSSFYTVVPLDGSTGTLPECGSLGGSKEVFFFPFQDDASVDGAESIKVEVKRLDYGDASCLSLWSMKELTPDMAALPLQALQVSLANVSDVLL